MPNSPIKTPEEEGSEPQKTDCRSVWNDHVTCGHDVCYAEPFENGKNHLKRAKERFFQNECQHRFMETRLRGLGLFDLEMLKFHCYNFTTSMPLFTFQIILFLKLLHCAYFFPMIIIFTVIYRYICA